MNNWLLRFSVCAILHCAALSFLLAQGKVYLVLGSDTGIWDNMDVAAYHCHYNLSLFTARADNAYQVMDPAFRNGLVDSYGQTVKLTWWMMAGNIFRYADNTDVPIPNILTLGLMKKFHGDAIAQWGDELTLHYHTFVWSDYNGDGKYYWNQAHTFAECRDDFDFTLAQYLLEQNVFPVSFRSGWHFMDNTWQNYLNTLLPYSLHDDYPNVRMTTQEPIDNVFDWSRAPGSFVPYQPSAADYQVPGGTKGWNVRSIHMGNVGQSLMDQIFASAAAGQDQVACLWAHLPETDFLTNICKIDSLAHASAAKYATVQFRYCSAVEAMQRWRGVYGQTTPQLNVQENVEGENEKFTITTDQPIFQQQPFVAVKDIYERYQILSCDKLSPNTWKTSIAVPRASLVKVGVAVTDTAGNLATQIIRRLPDDAYVDNSDGFYSEESGVWTSTTTGCWGQDARIAQLTASDSVRVRWILPVEQDGRYNIFVRVPSVSNPAGKILFEVNAGTTRIDSAYFPGPLPAKEWVFIGSPTLSQSESNSILMTVSGSGQPGTYAVSDVVKLSPLVVERSIVLPASIVDFGTVSQLDTVVLGLRIMNRGSGPLTVSGVESKESAVMCTSSFPIIVPSMNSVTVNLRFQAVSIGRMNDTLLIASDDPIRQVAAVACSGLVERYFTIADNDDSLSYREYGLWHYSNAQANGPTSRYSYLTDPPGAYALFERTLSVSGMYNVLGIVPTTVNAANKALYLVLADGHTLDSMYVDQNKGSGSWVLIGSYPFSAGMTASVKIVNTGASTAGAVLRADGIKFALDGDPMSSGNSRNLSIPRNFVLEQNFPNPFNPSTKIRFATPSRCTVRLEVLNVLGQVVALLIDETMESGYHETTWTAGVSSGIYFCRLTASMTDNSRKAFQIVRKMLVIR